MGYRLCRYNEFQVNLIPLLLTFRIFGFAQDRMRLGKRIQASLIPLLSAFTTLASPKIGFKKIEDMAKNTEETLQTYNMLGEGTSVKGDLQTEGNLRIDGQFEGNICVKGKLVVGKAGMVTGVVNCTAAEIEGCMKIEKMKVDGLLSVKSTANIEGVIEVDRLYIEQGAVFNGQCIMSADKAS